MKDIVINNIIKQIKKYDNYDDIKIEEIKYGLETIYLTIIKTIVFIIIALLIDTIKELGLFMLFYGILRLTGFGVHAQKSIHCWISSICIFILIPIFIKYIELSNYILYPLLFIFFIILAIYAPADTPKRPLINKKKRIIYKILTIITSFIYVIYILCIKNNIIISNTLFYSMILQSFLVAPFSYKIFGVPYKNYKTYKRKENKK